MEYVKMPELLSSEAAKVLAGNMDAIREMVNSREGNSACHGDDDECCCPKKVKFIFVLNNVVIININAVCEDDKKDKKDKRCC